MIGIYMYIDKTNNKKYIGQSTNIEHRKKAHRNSNDTPFDKILKQKGEQNFDFKIIELCSIEKLDEREVYWINYFNSFYEGYNCNPGGSSVRGQYTSNALISDDTAKNIINLLINTNLSQQEIANRNNCSKDIVTSINNCRTWLHLHNFNKNIRQECGKSTTKNPKRITKQEALEIIELLQYSELPQTKIAEQFNVTRGVVGGINNCHSWTELHDFKNNIRKESNNLLNEKLYVKSKLTNQQALKLIDLLINTQMTQQEIADLFSISCSLVHNINACRTYTELHNYKKNIRKEAKLAKI